jgi:hypothetical protein
MGPKKSRKVPYVILQKSSFINLDFGRRNILERLERRTSSKANQIESASRLN